MDYEWMIDWFVAQCWAFVSVGVGECQSEDSFVCFGVKPTQRACMWDLLWDRKRMREGKVPEQIRRRQSAGESSQQKLGEADGQRKATARTYGPRGWVGQRERISQYSWWLCGNFTRIHTHNSPQMHRKLHKSLTNFSLLVLGANPSPWLFVLLFLHFFSCVCCVWCICKEMWNTPGHRWEKPLDNWMTMSGLGGWDSGGLASGCIVTG